MASLADTIIFVDYHAAIGEGKTPCPPPLRTLLDRPVIASLLLTGLSGTNTGTPPAARTIGPNAMKYGSTMIT